MTTNHYFFRLDNWFKNGEPHLHPNYDLAHFEFTGAALQGIREGAYALTNSRHHKNKKNHFIKETIINISDLKLIRSSTMGENDYRNFVNGLSKNEFNDQLNKLGMLVYAEKIILPYLHNDGSLPNIHPCNANLHLSHEYFYISCIEKIPEYESVLYFQSRIFDIGLLDFILKTTDVPVRLFE